MRNGIVKPNDRMIGSLAITFVLMFSAVLARAQDCPNYQDYLEWIPGATLPDRPVDVAISGDHAFAAIKGLGLQVISIIDPRSPEAVATIDSLPTANSVVVVGDRAFVLTWDAGLHIFDVSSPRTPFWMGSVELVSWSWEVAVSGSYAYVGAESGAFSVVDASDPTSPEVVGMLSSFGALQGVAVAGDFVCAASDMSGLLVIDVGDPENPIISGSVAVPGCSRKVDVTEGYAYIVDSCHGFNVIDISNPASPLLSGSVEIPNGAFDLAVSGSYAYVACGDNDPEFHSGSLEVINISIAETPFIDGSLESMEELSCVALVGDYALSNPGVFVPSSGGIVGTLAVAWIGCEPVSGVPGIQGVMVNPDLDQNVPNPFNPQTTIAFEIPRQVVVSLRVFDISGRLVKNLIAGESRTPGPHEVVWNGRDDAGRQCASGTYFYRLEAGSFSETKRMVLVK